MKINITFWLKSLGYFLLFLLVIALFYGAGGWYQARNDADELRQIAKDMADNGLGINDLGSNQSGGNRSTFIIKVEDPNFLNHNGVDFSTDGAGATTITQSLAKRLAFSNFKPGYQKIRQTGYALGLETKLEKNEIFILFLNTAHMGPYPTGWVKGFHRASRLQYRKPASQINDEEFIALLSVMITPAQLRLDQPNAELEERIKRITKLLEDQCTPLDHSDVWLEGCA